MTSLQNLGLRVSVGATVLSALFAAPAAGRTVHLTDGRDSPASADITSVDYRNGEARAAVTVHVRRLPPTGRLLTLVGAPDSDVIYHATVWVRSDGTIGRRLELVTDVSRMRRTCAMTAAWSARTDSIDVSVPHTCLEFGRFLERHWMKVRATVAGNQDAARGVDVGRGSSPGCATSGEIDGLRRGSTRTRVHALLDTAGRFGDGAAGGYSRVYRSCSGGKPWFVEYRGSTHTLVATGRVT